MVIGEAIKAAVEKSSFQRFQMDSIDELSFKCVERWTKKYSKNDYRLFW